MFSYDSPNIFVNFFIYFSLFITALLFYSSFFFEVPFYKGWAFKAFLFCCCFYVIIYVLN